MKVEMNPGSKSASFDRTYFCPTQNLYNMLQVGQAAPEFSLPDQNGKIHSLKDYKGKKLVLFFYPKDNTPTCTVEACNLRDHIGLLRKERIEVLGVSADTVQMHKKFETKHALPFPLLADTDRKMIDAYGVWGEKKLFGVNYMGIHRITFLINEKGEIDHIINKVNSKNHAGQILETWKRPS